MTTTKYRTTDGKLLCISIDADNNHSARLFEDGILIKSCTEYMSHTLGGIAAAFGYHAEDLTVDQNTYHREMNDDVVFDRVQNMTIEQVEGLHKWIMGCPVRDLPGYYKLGHKRALAAADMFINVLEQRIRMLKLANNDES